MYISQLWMITTAVGVTNILGVEKIPDAGVPLRGALHAAAVLPAALVAALVQHRLAAPCACAASL